VNNGLVQLNRKCCRLQERRHALLSGSTHHMRGIAVILRAQAAGRKTGRRSRFLLNGSIRTTNGSSTGRAGSNDLGAAPGEGLLCSQLQPKTSVKNWL